ncbi:hypothetical protein ES702_05463 [subsurface metagenome]
MSDFNIEIAPIVKKIGAETVFKGSGMSHFSYVDGQGFHVTTNTPGLPEYKVHNPAGNMFPNKPLHLKDMPKFR